MKRRPVGFCSEQTALYAMLAKLRATIETEYSVFLPVSFWLTREGLRRSVAPAADRVLRIISFFPRRPKVLDAEDDYVLVKFNEELFEYATHAHRHGLATLAGVPIATSLFQLARCDVSWFAIESETRVTGPKFMQLPLTGRFPQSEQPFGLVGPLSASRMLTHIRDNSVEMPWAVAVERVRELRLQHDRPRSPWSPQTYRPILLLLGN
jgi:hypothetical protein